MYNNILFPTDGSKGADAALEHARDLASKYDATVHVLYVADSENELSHMSIVDEGTGASGMVKPDKVEQSSGMTKKGGTGMDRLEAAGEKVVKTTAENLDESNVDTVSEVRHGNPYRTIVNYADENGIDIIVMATHGRRGIDRYLLGSVTEKVVRTADVPVLTVRLSEE